MSAFTTPLYLQFIDGQNWRVTREFDFASDTLERILCVPRGFITDFASIPRVLWSWLPPIGSYGKAAVVHDMLYCGHIRYRPSRTSVTLHQRRIPWMDITRKQADQVLLEGMEALGVNWCSRWVIYLGVRVGGRRHFRASMRRRR